jgi:AcrR family transcriptional regulator
METNIRELPLQERSRQRVEMVVEATKIVLVEKGYSDLTLAAVCDQANVKQTSIYRYWPNKQALLAAALTEKATEGHWHDLFKDNIDMLETYLDENPWFTEAQNAIKTEKALMSRYRDMLSYFTVQYNHILRRAGLNAPAEHEAAMARMVVSVLDMFLMELGRNNDSKLQIAETKRETLNIIIRYLEPFMAS